MNGLWSFSLSACWNNQASVSTWNGSFSQERHSIKQMLLAWVLYVYDYEIELSEFYFNFEVSNHCQLDFCLSVGFMASFLENGNIFGGTQL